MKTLEHTLQISGTGIPGITVTQLKRIGKLCLYQRDDEVYEVFYVKTRPAESVFGKDYPEREQYPNNEDFGQTAWCFKTKEMAERKFNTLKQRGV